MKSIKKYILSLGVVAAALSLGSCTGDLDLMPSDPRDITATDFASDPEGYMDQVMGQVYMAFVNHGPNNESQVAGFDGGMSTFGRALFNLEEIPTDEACWQSSTDAGLFSLQYGNISSDNDAIFGSYSRLMINVALCNDFIRTVNDNLFALSTDAQKEKATEYVRQCKTLRSVCYFYLMSLFGNVPYADESVAIGTMAPQMKSSEIFPLVTETLEAVVAEYGQGGMNPAYGYVGVDAAEGFLVKLYLNAEVFTGTPAWDKCLSHAKNIIARHQGKGFKNSGLTMGYHQNFAANNIDHVVGGSGVPEILFLLPQKYPELMSYGNSTVMILGFIAEDVDKAFFNVGNGWKCAKGRPQLVNRFQWNEVDQKTSPDKRVALWRTSKDGYVNQMPSLQQSQWNENGYLTPKYINRNVDDNNVVDLNTQPAFNGDKYVTTNYPVLRLAEIYLSAAEAALHGASSKDEALTYVNFIRERAGVAPWSLAELTLETLQDERSRELYLENTRRTDLIRYGKWVSGINWSWKNNALDGQNFAPSAVLYPIPSQVLAISPYEQNPGY